jgi:RNA polymerase sigma-70 factor, ECF subfamily
MADDQADTVTHLLAAARAGDPGAHTLVVSKLYGELHRAAAALMARERPGHTLQPTALLNEAVLKLFGGDAPPPAVNDRYLFASAVQAMRQVLVDHARRRAAEKRGGGIDRVPLDDVLDWYGKQGAAEVIDVHEAIERLAAVDERLSQVVSLRFFGGLTVPEVADHLGVSVTTVEGDWRFARSWLRRELTRGDE